jgi:hypothetical protein
MEHRDESNEMVIHDGELMTEIVQVMTNGAYGRLAG